jgi:hypothetical protein
MQGSEWTDDSSVTAHRARVQSKLDQITQQVKAALDQAGVDIPVFFIVPTSGDAIVTFGTIIDPPDHQWKRVSEVVVSVVRQSVGLDQVRCREVICATTSDQLGSTQEASR